MTEDRTGRELTPRPTEPEGVVAPREAPVPANVPPADVRFAAGEQMHTVGLTEERAGQVVRQSSNARMVAFLAVLIFVLFIPIYWLYDIGLPVLGMPGRLEKEASEQYVTDVGRGYALFLANCARCHDSKTGAPGNGLGNIGPALNDQAKLYKALTEAGLPGTGHLNPNYLQNVLEVGGRYVCGDPKSVMPAWLEPAGPLNYREVQEIITWILASQDTQFVYQPAHAEAGATIPPPVTVEGWTDPAWTPAPGATPVPACWRAPASTAAASTPAPVTSPGTVENPRVIEIEGTSNLQWVDPVSGQPLSAINVVQGETIQFHIVNDTAVEHSFHLGSGDELSTASEPNSFPGVPGFTQDTSPQMFTLTVDQLAAINPQFACTVPGHYTTMHGDILVQAGGGQSGSPAPSLADTSAPSSSSPSSPAPSLSPAPSAAP